MFIVIVGTMYSGKSTLEDYLVSRHGFTSIHLESANHYLGLGGDNGPGTGSRQKQARDRFSDSFLTLNSPNPADSCDGVGGETPRIGGVVTRRVWSRSLKEMLDHVTRDWRNHYVTADAVCSDELRKFAVRPFVLIVNVDAPILERFRRMTRLAKQHVSLEKFIIEHDAEVYGRNLLRPQQIDGRSPIQELDKLSHLRIDNPFVTISEFHAHLASLDLLNVDRLRPHWDTYFMHLASLASRRSNCMKRRVGAILVRNNRVVATGYNGTAKGLRNCNDGGCPRCNSGSSSGVALDLCVCLHAEENALLEGGKDQFENAVLYCNTCPCLGCSVKIIQCGVKEVVYHLSYKVDEASAELFREAGVTIRRHAPPDPF